MNPTQLARQIEATYRNYLKTTFYFKDPDFRASFEKALEAGHLSKGPYLEATPVFQRGAITRELFRDLLDATPDDGFLEALHGERPLYTHQEEAIKQAFAGRNVVVATGTGSGKTESFLYPILLHLYKEFQRRELGPGVRALILYPMNALVNDQKKRLTEFCRRLKEAGSPFRFTFGQYVGETPENESDTRRNAEDRLAERKNNDHCIFEDGRVVHGELVLRSEMRETPPHILLTNYSMLEYLLLRPDDSPLFDHGKARWWKFIVLDEAHQYRGSTGIEIAMLLRRLKQRLREGGRSEGFTCIATSATLVDGEENKGAVAEFASALFGETFDETDVILGKPVPPPEESDRKLSPADYEVLSETLKRADSSDCSGIHELLRKFEIEVSEGERLEVSIAKILQKDGRACRLRRLLAEKPREVTEVANEVFDDLPRQEEREAVLTRLVQLLLKAHDPESGAPLLSARYHLFLRALEGAFITYAPRKEVFLERKAVPEEATSFEVALCRNCGQHYIVTGNDFERAGCILEPQRDPNESNFGVTFLRPLENEDATDNSGANYKLCVRCGSVKGDCDHDETLGVVKEPNPKDADRADQIVKCGACGYSAAGRDPVREVIHGNDGPHAVIATTLYLQLPEERKKVLAFADNRQDAAFFAWYLENSFKDIQSRNYVYRAMKEISPFPAEGLSLAELADKLYVLFEKLKCFPESEGSLDRKKRVWTAIYREFLTEERKISLEGVGLLRWSIKWPSALRIPTSLMSPPWSLTEDEAYDLLFALLDTMRSEKAVNLRLPPNVSLTWSDLGLQNQQPPAYSIGKPSGRTGIRSWDGKKTTQVNYLVNILKRIHAKTSDREAIEEAQKLLRIIWQELCQLADGDSESALLLRAKDARQLNPDWWRASLLGENDKIYRCDICGLLQTASVKNVCRRYRCPGALKPITQRDLEANHYRDLYLAELPGRLRVEEHTAQLEDDIARKFQREFQEGKIHVLSCSTTFELGVDLGDLDTIFLRNVPPEAFNYAQRVGRSGRRSGFPGFAVTYCRRSPHDLYHFANPERMLSGKVRPPVLHLRNNKILTRHVTATALSSFFRKNPDRFGDVTKLFDNLLQPRGVKDFNKFLHSYGTELYDSLRKTFSDIDLESFELGSHRWIDAIGGEDSRFAAAELELSSDYKSLTELKQKLEVSSDYKTVTELKQKFQSVTWAIVRANTIASEEALSFLSRKAVIPKYGFPVDVVELDVINTEEKNVQLQRDLSIAIAEFAPTSEVVAAKKLWVSYGLKRVPEKEWPRKCYVRCHKHGTFFVWDEGATPDFEPCCDNTKPQTHNISTFIVPQFGFVTNRKPPEAPKGRPQRAFTSRPYFVGSIGAPPATFGVPRGKGLLQMTKASPGRMVVLCEGRRRHGFYICRECGAGFRERKNEHKDRFGRPCQGTLDNVSLGHEFVTDVVQMDFFASTPPNIVGFSFSLAYALLEGVAETLEVPSTDLDTTVTNTRIPFIPRIVLYDCVPGGAGLVARLEAEGIFKASLEAALNRVSGACGCPESSSCYGCLRSYRNQFAHTILQRGPVKTYLESLLEQW